MTQKKITKAQLRERMESIRLDLVQRIEAEDAGLSDAPADIEARRARVFDVQTGFRFFLETYFPHHIRGDTWSAFHDYLIDEVVPNVTASPEAEAEAVAAPRGEAKSSLTTKVGPVWCAVRALLQPFGERVDAVVNYDHFGIVPELVDAYADMVHRLAADWYQRVTRYGTTGFVKSRLKPSPGD